MKIVKKALKISGIVFIILLAALFVLPIIFKGRIVEEVKTQINENVNADVSFEDFDLTFFKNFPHLTFVIEKLSVINRAPFEGDTLTYIGEFSFALNLSSIISSMSDDGQIKIRSINIDKPYINIKVLEDGTANYDIAMPSEDTTAVEEDTSETAFNIGLKKLTINDARIIYDDASLGFYLMLKGFNHELKGDFTQDVFDMQTKSFADVLTVGYEGIKYLNKVNMDIKADLEMDMLNSKYTFKENEFRLNELFMGIDGYVAMPGDDIDMDLKFYTKKTEFKNILSLLPAVYTSDFKDVKTKGKLALNGDAKGIYNENSIPAFNFKLLVENAMFQYPELPTPVNNINIDLEMSNPDGVDDHTVINLKTFHIEIGSEPFDANMLLKTPVSNPDINASMKGMVNLANINDIMPLEDVSKLSGIIKTNMAFNGKMSYIDNEQYDKFHASGGLEIIDMVYVSEDLPQGIQLHTMLLSFNPQNIALNEFSAHLGRSDLKASGSLENYLAYALKDDEPLKGVLILTSNLIDANEWLTEEESEEGENAAVSAEDTLELTVFEVPGKIDFTMSSSMEKILYDNMVLQKVQGTLAIKNKTVRLYDFQMNTLGGTITMNGTYDTKDINKPKFDFGIDIQNLDIKQSVKTFDIIKEYAPPAKSAVGTFNTQLTIAGDLGQDMMPVYESLKGAGNLELRDVALKDMKILNKLAEALKKPDLKEMNIGDIDMRYAIKDSRMYVEPYQLVYQNINMTISGSNGLDGSIDYKVSMGIPGKEMGAGMAAGLMGSLGQHGLEFDNVIKLDIKIEGTYDKPKIKVKMKDLAKNVKEAVKEEIKKEIEVKKEEIKEDIKKKVNEEAEKIIKEAEKQADIVRNEAKVFAESVRKEGYANAQNLENEAKNPLAKIATKKVADKLRKETDKKADKFIRDANLKADNLIIKAKEKAAKLTGN